MQIEIIDNHSVAVDLLKGGWVLDAGARGHIFTRNLAKRGCKVLALDPGWDVPPIDEQNIKTARLALVGIGQPSYWKLGLIEDQNAMRLETPMDSVPEHNPRHACVADNITNFMNQLNITCWDVVKLNIEGSEYEVLETWPGPIADQIVFSFHEHTDRKRGKEECDRIINKLRQWYDIYNQVWEPRYCTYANYWDVLAIRKGLA